MKRGRAAGKVVVGQGSRVGNVGHNSIGTFGVPVHSLPPATVARAGDGDGGGMMGAISIGADVEAGNVGHCSHGHHVSHPPPPPTASVPPTSALNNVANAPPSSAQPLPSPSAAIGLTSLSASSSSSPSSSSSSSAAGPLSLPAQALPHIMFSYSWAYKEAAHQIAREVKSRGYRVWIDHGNMGSELARSLGEAVEQCRLLVAFISPEYMVSDMCRKELNLANSERKKIVPVRVQCATQPTARWSFTSEVKLIIAPYLYETIDLPHPQAKVSAEQLDVVVRRVVQDWENPVR